MMPAKTSGRSKYQTLLRDLKKRIQDAQLRAALAVNRELVLLYWSIGRDIVARQEREGWGAKVIESLAADLRLAFPEMTGLSTRNFKYMKSFAAAWPDGEKVQAVLAQISWYHNVALIDKVKKPEERLWYAERCIENGWSRNVLVIQIESKLYRRQRRAISNFRRTLPPAQSDLAQQILKDPYNFEFLAMSTKVKERDLEAALVERMRQLLLELGSGFAFVGSQYRLNIGGEDFRLDLLFYHLHLHCYVVIELKSGPFQPEHMGKMNFYLSAVDRILRHDGDGPTIGLILCKSKNQIIVEYALQDSSHPLGVAEFRVLPEKWKRSLPSAEELEARLIEPASKPGAIR